MIIQGEIVYVSEPQEKQGKGNSTYQIVEIIYKPSDGSGAKTQKVVSFNSPTVLDALSEYDNGDKFWVRSEKNEQGYWQWNEISKEPLEGASDTTVKPTNTRRSPSPDKPTSGGKVVGNNYETPQERGRKQIYIVRQSSVDRAMSVRGELDPFKAADFKKIMELAGKIEEWTFRGYKINEDDTITRGE